jgi:hypothetical protein
MLPKPQQPPLTLEALPGFVPMKASRAGLSAA